MDGRNPAPPKKPWNGDSPANTNKRWPPMVSTWCRSSSILQGHPKHKYACSRFWLQVFKAQVGTRSLTSAFHILWGSWCFSRLYCLVLSDPSLAVGAQAKTCCKRPCHCPKDILWLDKIHFAPPKKPWNDIIPIPQREYQQTLWFPPWFLRCYEMDFATIHRMLCFGGDSRNWLRAVLNSRSMGSVLVHLEPIQSNRRPLNRIELEETVRFNSQAPAPQQLLFSIFLHVLLIRLALPESSCWGAGIWL